MLSGSINRLLSICLLLLLGCPLSAQNETTAKYRVSFSGNWTLVSSPGGVPGNAHFTTLAVATHNSSVTFWRVGEKATGGVEILAETGGTSTFINEVNASPHKDQAFTQSVSFGGTGTASFELTAKRSHPLLTLLTMIGPSPDWFVGLSGYSLLDGDSNWLNQANIDLFPYDAGTEDGTSFSLSNPDTNPKENIKNISGMYEFSNAPMARITITRMDAPQSAPSIASITRPSSANRFTNADTVRWIVTFSESVVNVSSGDFTVSNTTARVSSVSRVSGGTTSYEVTVSGGDLADLDAVISLGLSSQQDITNNSGTALSSTLPSNVATYTIDNTSPTVASVAPKRHAISPFSVSISFSEALRATSFTLEGDATAANATVSAPVRSDTGYSVTVTPDDSTRSATIVLMIRAGAAIDLAGNAGSSHIESISYVPAVDDAPAVVQSVSALSKDGTYGVGETLEIGVTFSRVVTVTGRPTLELAMESNEARSASYQQGSNSPTLEFSYVVTSGDSASDLDYVDTNSLKLNGGSITSDGFNANLSLPSPGSPGSLSDNSEIAVDSTRTRSVPNFGNQEILNLNLRVNTAMSPLQLPLASGGQGELTYSLQPDLPRGLSLSIVDERNVLSGTPQEELEATTYSWTATDEAGEFSTLNFDITVVANALLEFAENAVISDQILVQNSEIAPIVLPAATGGQGTLVYRLSPQLPEGLTFDHASRTISGAPNEIFLESEFLWQVSDEEGASASLTFKLRVVRDEQPSFSQDASIPEQLFITDLTIKPLLLPVARGGNGTLIYVLRPTLPAGLTLNPATHTISGTPTASQEKTRYTWEAKDSDGDAATLQFTIAVEEDVQPEFPIGSTVADSVFVQNSVIEAIALPDAQGGNRELTYTLEPELPRGLEYDSATKEIAGTPTSIQPKTTYSWSVVDIDGDSAALQFTLTVLEDLQPVFSSVVEDRSFIQNSPIDPFALPVAMGGNGALIYRLSPELPTGLELDLDSFEVSGSPTTPQTETTFTWTALDEDKDAVSIAFNVTVLLDLQPKFSATSRSLDDVYTQNSQIEDVILPSAESGNGSLTYMLAPELPTGLNFDLASKNISGTPTEPQKPTEYTWTATDIDGDLATFRFTLTVIEDLFPAFASGASISDQVAIEDFSIEPFQLPRATGGNGALVHVLMPSLPTGILLDTSSFEVSGTATDPSPRTLYSWTATDADGDSETIRFHLTVEEDLQPQFIETVDNQIYIVGDAINVLQLPDATSGNGSLTYELTPNVSSGLRFDSNAHSISGTPNAEMPTTRYSWSVSDVDGDSTVIEFTITIHPAAPMVVGSIASLHLFVGGATTTVNMSAAIDGKVESWQVAVTDPNVLSTTVGSSGMVSVTPRHEGSTDVTATASNITGSASVTFNVAVETHVAEETQLDTTLNMQAGSILSSALSVFKHRSDVFSQHAGTTQPTSLAPISLSSSSGAPSAATLIWSRDSRQYLAPTEPISNHDIWSSGIPSSSQWLPRNLAHSTSRWSAWVALDLQGHTAESNANSVEGSMSSQYLGAELALGTNTYVGVAVARHGLNSDYEFSNVEARGSGALETSLTGFYPYLQSGNNDSFSMFLVGGFASGESEIERSHAHGVDAVADAEMSVFGGGIDYVVMHKDKIALSIVADAGNASLSTSADSGLLQSRETSSSRVTVGTNLAFVHDGDNGSFVSSADLRLANRGGDGETGTGYVLGGNLSYWGERFDLMVDGRIMSVSSASDTTQSSLTARLRFKARPSGSGMTLNLKPHWGNGIRKIDNQLQSLLIEDPIAGSHFSPQGTSIEGAIGYGFLLQQQSKLVVPRFSWLNSPNGYRRTKFGLEVDFDLTGNSISKLQAELLYDHHGQNSPQLGLRVTGEVRL